MPRSPTKRVDRPAISQRQVADDFDRLADSYEDDISSAVAFSGLEHSFFIDVKRDHLVRLASQSGALAELDVVDVGCGLGTYHPGLKNTFHSLSGVDVSESSIERAAERHPFVTYTSYDGGRLPYPDNSFDIAFAICVVHHVPPAQWPAFLLEMRRVLRPSGQALIFEHNPYNPVTRHIVNSCEMDKDAVLLTPRRLRRLFDDAGFTAIKTRTILSVPPKGAVLRWLDTVLGRLPLGAQYFLQARKPAS